MALRYGLHPATLDRWRAVLAIQKQFETKMGCSIYAVLPGAAENSLGIIPGNTESPWQIPIHMASPKLVSFVPLLPLTLL